MRSVRRLVRAGLRRYGYDVVRLAALPASPQPQASAEPTASNPPEEDHQAASQHYEQITGLGDMDSDFPPIYEACRRFSMTSAQRMYALSRAVRYIEKAGIPGEIVECGVWRGGSMMVAAKTLLDLNSRHRTLRLFDTYEGLPKPDDNDVDVWGNDAADWWEQKRTSDQSSEWALARLDEVRANLAATGYPEDRMIYVKGMVEETIPAEAPEQIALLRLDTDWYASTRHEMEHLFPRLSRNGVLIIDDYGHFKGARKAVDEYIAAHDLPLMLVRIDYTGRLAIKITD